MSTVEPNQQNKDIKKERILDEYFDGKIDREKVLNVVDRENLEKIESYMDMRRDPENVRLYD